MKKIILAAALLALMASCGKDDNSNRPRPGSTALIHLDPNTIRPNKGAEATLLTMEADPLGFRVWATDDTNPDFYVGVNGAYHKYTNGIWNFSPAVEWPTDASYYPMNFYALYPGADASMSVMPLPSTQTVTTEVTVAADVSTHVDILAGHQVANAKPASGNLAVVFHHIMSKINFALLMPSTYTAHVQGLGVFDVGFTGTYRLTSTPGWSVEPQTFVADYMYYGNILQSTTGASIIPTTALVGASPAKTPFYTTTTTPTAANANMILVPQTVLSRTWGGAVAPTAVPTTTESYIAMVYRMTEGSADVVGLSQAQNHSDWVGSALQTSGYAATDPLFVKVGFPFELAWYAGKGYTYNIPLELSGGNTGGYLLDVYFYDNMGNPTDLRVDAEFPGINIPDPLFGDGDIHLVPDPSEWDENETGL